MQAAADVLGLKWEEVRHLARVGLLGVREGRIPMRDVKAFSKDFIAASAVARHRRTSSRAVVANLARAGVTPATGPGVDGGRKIFFRRADLRAVEEV